MPPAAGAGPIACPTTSFTNALANAWLGSSGLPSIFTAEVNARARVRAAKASAALIVPSFTALSMPPLMLAPATAASAVAKPVIAPSLKLPPSSIWTCVGRHIAITWTPM
jgi:hypothetical protein